jgi:hypothetical protein
MGTLGYRRSAGRNVRTLGDIFDDLSSIAGAAMAAGTPGGVGAWLIAKLQEFQRLPNDANALEGQATRMRAVLVAERVGNDDVARLDNALSLLDTLRTNYPNVQQRVGAVTVAITPVMSRIQAGQWDSTVIAALAANGVDVIEAIHGIDTLTGLRDQAATQVQTVQHDPALPISVRQKLQQAVAGLNWLMVGTLGVLAVLLMRRRRA